MQIYNLFRIWEKNYVILTLFNINSCFNYNDRCKISVFDASPSHHPRIPFASTSLFNIFGALFVLPGNDVVRLVLASGC